ncbi:NACHT domain-containing protein [Actinomadura barringtoniae]|uniref:NACHT domain-containing protein n=1 Tax=Actinomadura barringtoniae TaxID=1427535 RepID=A0A939PJI8_9ACTN|nr:NACHT domain-containing protein [Actinomadura barringtoniae]MBO2453896.1 NACHT domain-containing protein [Actinomadura barringtoniae]
MSAIEEQEWRRALGDSTGRIDLTYVQVAASGRTARNARDSGRLAEDDICEYFNELKPRRLVITGEPGSGKTILALELLLALLKRRAPDGPVPVRLPLAAWDTQEPFADFLVTHLRKTFGWSKRKARWLVERNFVLPILDGLDEMDPALPNGRPDPKAPRAKAALAALNSYQVGREPGPLVITCRDEAYGKAGRLQYAAQIAIRPVLVKEARQYLLERADDRDRWKPLLDKPQLPSTPWRLCLVATVYESEGDPAEIARFRSPAKLDEFLLSRYIPAATELHPSSHTNVHQRLHLIARHLESRSVLEAADLWLIAGERRVKAVLEAVTLVGGALIAALILLLPHDGELVDASDRWPVSFVMAAVFFLWAGIYNQTWPRTISQVFPWRWPPHLFLAVPALVGFSTMAFMTGGLSFTLFVACSGLISLLSVQVVPPAKVMAPRKVIRTDLAANGVIAMVAFVGLTSLMVSSYALEYSLLIGALLTVYGYFVYFGGMGVRYLTALMRMRGKLPLRLIPFLDWAAEARLLRQTGPAYQFVHREFQEWLAARPTPDHS